VNKITEKVVVGFGSNFNWIGLYGPRTK